MNENEKIKGNIKISEDVICSIVAVAAAETEGVASVAAASGIDILNKKNHTKNIKIHIDENSITIDLTILVKYGAIINDVATKLQESVAVAVESMTGMEVVSVNVTVTGISFDEKKDETK